MANSTTQQVLGTQPVRIDADSSRSVTIRNLSSAKIYYYSTEKVSSETKDGTLEENGSVSISAPTWIVSASNSRYLTLEQPFQDKGIKFWPTFYANATAESGNDTACVNGKIWFITCHIFTDSTLTGIELLNGSVAETNKWIAALYDSDGNLVANSKLEGTTASGAKAYQQFAFTSQVKVPAGRYFVAIQGNGTTAKFYSVKANTIKTVTGSKEGTFGTLPKLEIPATFTANVGPIATTY